MTGNHPVIRLTASPGTGVAECQEVIRVRKGAESSL